MSLSPHENIRLSDKVAEAVRDEKPVVALESTIVTHGMPWPDNARVAKEVEAEIRAGGAVPATIAVIDGELRAGLSEAEIDALAQAKDVMKLSRADLAYAIATGRTGSTTVAATMIAAKLVGVDVFATGGIGGVHRGAAESFDISADLEELAMTDVIVVCAGAKAILDVAKTLEVLETKGVPVICYGTDVFPAFWSRESPFPAPLRMDSAEEIAAHARARAALGLTGGTLIANPVPQGAEIPAAEIAAHIEAAQDMAARDGIKGKDVTPYLLEKMLDLTEGRSLETNIALVKSNARLAAEIAVAMAELG